jgi:hypothetical protein
MFVTRGPHEFDRTMRELRGQLGDLIAFDVDYRPGKFGVCAGVTVGRRMETTRSGSKFNTGWFAGCLDWYAPMGEPNRLYLAGPRWWYMIGLPDNREDEWIGDLDRVAQFRTVRTRWRLVRGQVWTPEGGWSQDDRWSWFVRSPRN